MAFRAPSTAIVSRCCLQKSVAWPGVFDEHQGSFQDWPSHCFLNWKIRLFLPFYSFLLLHGGSWSWTAFWQLFSGDGIIAIRISVQDVSCGQSSMQLQSEQFEKTFSCLDFSRTICYRKKVEKMSSEKQVFSSIPLMTWRFFFVPFSGLSGSVAMEMTKPCVMPWHFGRAIPHDAFGRFDLYRQLCLQLGSSTLKKCNVFLAWPQLTTGHGLTWGMNVPWIISNLLSRFELRGVGLCSVTPYACILLLLQTLATSQHRPKRVKEMTWQGR